MPLVEPKDKIRRQHWLDAVKPISGATLVDRYWVCDDDGLYWYQSGKHSWTPQCNSNKAIVESLLRMYPGARVEFVEIVFVKHYDDENGYNPW